MKNPNNKAAYWMLSGEGELGTWERVVTTPLGIKRRLTKERCGDDRWARAYGDIYETQDGQIVGHDIEYGVPRCLPDEACQDIMKPANA